MITHIWFQNKLSLCPLNWALCFLINGYSIQCGALQNNSLCPGGVTWMEVRYCHRPTESKPSAIMSSAGQWWVLSGLYQLSFGLVKGPLVHSVLFCLKAFGLRYLLRLLRKRFGLDFCFAFLFVCFQISRGIVDSDSCFQLLLPFEGILFSAFPCLGVLCFWSILTSYHLFVPWHSPNTKSSIFLWLLLLATFC